MKQPLTSTPAAGSDVEDGMLHRSMTAPVAAAHRQADVFANAHNLVSSELNGISVNSGEFWKVWADAGGNVDAYIKDTLPTYGLIGALALSKQLSMTTDPPDALPEKSAMMIMYAALSMLSSLMSFSLIIICMVVKTQYSCCICQETRVKFACKFGFVVPMLFSIMIAMGACWFGALMIEIHSLYDESIFFVLLVETAVIALFFFVLFPIWVQRWNANKNYGPQIPVMLQRQQMSAKMN